MERQTNPLDATRARTLGRYWPVTLTLALGTVLTLGMFSLVEHHQAEQRRQRFWQQANNAAAAVRKKLGDNLEVLYSIRDLWGASAHVTRRDFQHFAAAQRSRQSGIQALEWIPRVSAAERPAFERAARQSGMADFRFTEVGPDGHLKAAGPRAEYYPVYYVEPFVGNERALGFAPVMPARDAAIEQAWRTGTAVATGRIRLVQESGSQNGLAIFVPVFRSEVVPATPQARQRDLLGLVEGVFRLDDMVAAAMGGLDLSGLSLTLTDESAPPQERLLATSVASGGDALDPRSASGPLWSDSFDMGGRRWAVHFFLRSSQTDPLESPWGILVGGFLITGLAGVSLYNLVDRKEQIEHQVELRTTELTRATQDLQRSEATLSAIVTNATDAIFIKDLEGRFLLANPMVVQLLRRPLDQIIGVSDTEVFPPEVVARIRAQDQRVIAEGQALTHVETLETAPGRVFLTSKFPFLSATGEPIGVIGISRDITPLQQAEAALREERDRAQRYLDVAGVMIVIIDPAGRLTLANRKAGEILGWTPAEMVGQPWFETFVPDRARGAALDAFQRGIARGEEPASRVESLVRTRQGEERRIVWNNVTLRDPEGRILGLLCSGSDVTDYKRAIEEVAHREAELEKVREIDRLKSNFVSSISHDLRTPLTSIKGYAEFLGDGIGGDLSVQQHEFVAQIERGTRRLENLVDDLLDFARFDAGTFTLRREAVDLGGLLQEVAASMQPQFEESRLHLTLSLPDGPLVGLLDQQRIERVLANLLSNAIKFTPPEGEICLRAERVGSELRCEVVDSGPGIDPADVPRLFQRFSQLATGQHKGGTGLGLSISKAIIEAHGGHIGVTSERGAGATFWFTLPAPSPTLMGAEGMHHAPDRPHPRQ